MTTRSYILAAVCASLFAVGNAGAAEQNDIPDYILTGDDHNDAISLWDCQLSSTEEIAFQLRIWGNKEGAINTNSLAWDFKNNVLQLTHEVGTSTLEIDSTNEQNLLFTTRSGERGSCSKIEHETEFFVSFFDDFDTNSNVQTWLVENQKSLGRPYQCVEQLSDSVQTEFSIQFEPGQLALINGEQLIWSTDELNNIILSGANGPTVWSSITAENFANSHIFTGIQNGKTIRCT